MLGLLKRDGSDPGVSLEIMSRASVKSAFEAKLMLGEPLELFLAPRKYRHRLNHLLAVWKVQACDYVAIMRRRWRLSQAQFADLFMTDVRVVKRWEAHESKPTIRHQWFLQLFAPNRIVSSGPHAPPRKSERVSATTCTAPPAAGTFLTFPSVKTEPAVVG
jgi:DNA-binding transcriptional regulator YiaG